MPIDMDFELVYPKTTVSFTDRSFLLEEFEYQRNEIENYTNDKIQMYKILSETTLSSIRENAESILQTLTEWIHRAIKHIREIMSKFWRYLQGFLDDEIYIKNNKDILSQYGSYAFTIKGFKYTFENNQIARLFDSQVHDLAELTNICNSSNTEAIYAKFNDAYHRGFTNNTEEYYGYIRARILGKNGYIERDDFPSKCKRSFRNGRKASEPELLTINKSYIDGILNYVIRQDGYNGLKRDVEKESADIDRMLNALAKNLDALVKAASKYRGNHSENIYALAISHANRIGTMANNVYREMLIYLNLKLAAIKEMAIQNNHIAVEAIHKIKDFRRQVPMK